MDSDEYTSEDAKRKKDVEKVDNAFRKSKKTNRSPQKESQDKEDKIDLLTEMMKELMKDIKEIKQDQKTHQQELKEIKQENVKLKEENMILREKMKNIEGRLRRIEKEQAKNSIVISGLEMEKKDGEELKQSLERFLEGTIGVNVQIKEARKIGTKICKVDLSSVYEKEAVMKNKNKLKRLQERIYINNEMTKEEREIQKKIKKIAEEERKKGKNTKIGFQKVMVDGTEWRWNREQEELIQNELKMDEAKN